MMASALVFLAAFTLYLHALCPTITSGDTSELILGGLHLDVSHPPGYPLLMCLIRLACELPAGGLAFRAGLLSATAGAAGCALLYSTARVLGCSRASAVLAAVLLAVMPYVWWQSTMVEKYSLQMCLAMLVLRVTLSPRSGFLSSAFTVSLALAHHPLALFLIPILVPKFLSAHQPSRGGSRVLAMALVLTVLPQGLRPLYSALRADALHRADSTGVQAINWGEPYHAGALFDYLALKFFRKRLTGDHDLARAGFSDHLKFFPAQLTWPGMAAGLVGLGTLVGRSWPLGSTLIGIILLTFLSSLQVALPPSLAAQNHQNAYLILALCAGVGVDRVRQYVSRWRGAWPLLALAAVSSLGLLAVTRAKLSDASRHFFVHDYIASLMRLAPPRAVLMGAFDYDLFAPRYFQEALGVRRDLTSLPIPHRAMPGHFTVRRQYQPWAAALLPGAILNFVETDSGFKILRRLVADNATRYCFAISGLSESAVPQDLFTIRGTLYVARGSACAGEADAGRALAAWRAISSRCWFMPAAAMPGFRTVLEHYAQGLWRTAMHVSLQREPHLQEAVLRTRARLIPDEAFAWLALGDHYAAREHTARALRCYQRAMELEPAAPATCLALLRLQVNAGARSAAEQHLRAFLSREPFASVSAAGSALAELDRRNLRAAVPFALRVLAEVAWQQADALPGNPEADIRRMALYRLAAELAPDWPQARDTYVEALLARERWEEAQQFIDRMNEKPGY